MGMSGRDFVSDEDLDARARRWLDEVANVPVHGALGEGIDSQRCGLSVEAEFPEKPDTTTAFWRFLKEETGGLPGGDR